MKIFLFIMAALCGYTVAGLNPAISLSKLIYKKDIRECGSGNPGFDRGISGGSAEKNLCFK